MFFHHLLGCGDFLMSANYLPKPILGEFEVNLASQSKICIALFALISGYGFQKSYMCEGVPYRKIWNRILKFLITYWTILFLVGIPYLVYFGKFNIDYLFINLFALFHNDDILYVSLSWYVKLYLEFLVILPLLKYISQRIHSVITELLLFVLIPIQLVHFLPDAESFYFGKIVFILSSVRLLLTWLPVFCTGIILAKYKFFEYISPLKKRMTSVC